MHASAYKTAQQFFEVYVSPLPTGRVVEIGARQVADGQRNLRALCPAGLEYLGVDLEPGINVDVVLADPYVFPFVSASVDVVLCTSVFEHCNFFWQLFEEILRILKPNGLLYINAPANGYVHRYPVDCWRFYPDSGVALVDWGRRRGHEVALLESFISDEDPSENPEEIWNDFVAVFAKGPNGEAAHSLRLADLRDDYANRRWPGKQELLRANRFPGRTHAEVQRWQRSLQTSQRRVFLYQIAYSEETWNSVPKGMLPLDNRANPRPDWAEYWPIRHFLQQEALDDDAFYGFLSPRFSEKTFFPPEALIDFVASVADDVDVAAFSPYFDLRALFRNVFEHGEYSHPGFLDLSKAVAAEIMPDVNLASVINTSMTGIFCNYFAAKPRFWRRWLSTCEKIFAMAESRDHPNFSELNRGYYHSSSTMPAKVFVIERIASLLLATSSEFKVAKFEKSTMTSTYCEFPDSLFRTLDTLKSQSLQGHSMLMNAFNHIQGDILSGDVVSRERKRLITENLSLGLGHRPSQGYENWCGVVSAAPSASPQSPGLGWLIRWIFR